RLVGGLRQVPRRRHRALGQGHSRSQHQGGVSSMTFPRRQFLHLATGAIALPAVLRMAHAENAPALQQKSIAERLAAYAHALRADDLDADTIERVKSHIIDSLGCGLAAFDEKPVRICREVALAARGGGATVIGTTRRAAPDLAAFANDA